MHPICDLQIEYSLISRGIESHILPVCRELGIGVTAYGVLSRGLISGHWSKERSGGQDFRSISPRFQGDNLDQNLRLVERIRAIADSMHASVAQVAIAWVAAQGQDIVPLVGARRREQPRRRRSLASAIQPPSSRTWTARREAGGSCYNFIWP